jgi:hypothetical protein
VDEWIWKRLEHKRDGRYNSCEIAGCLGLFLELQWQFETVDARYDHSYRWRGAGHPREPKSKWPRGRSAFGLFWISS